MAIEKTNVGKIELPTQGGDSGVGRGGLRNAWQELVDKGFRATLAKEMLARGISPEGVLDKLKKIWDQKVKIGQITRDAADMFIEKGIFPMEGGASRKDWKKVRSELMGNADFSGALIDYDTAKRAGDLDGQKEAYKRFGEAFKTKTGALPDETRTQAGNAFGYMGEEIDTAERKRPVVGGGGRGGGRGGDREPPRGPDFDLGDEEEGSGEPMRLDSIKTFEQAENYLKNRLNFAPLADLSLLRSFTREAEDVLHLAYNLAAREGLPPAKVVDLNKWMNSRVHALEYWHGAWVKCSGDAKKFSDLVTEGKKFKGVDIILILSNKRAAEAFHTGGGFFKDIVDLGSGSAIYGKIVQRVTGATDVMEREMVEILDDQGQQYWVIDDKGQPKKLEVFKYRFDDYEFGRNFGLTAYLHSPGYKDGYPRRKYLLEFEDVYDASGTPIGQRLKADRGDCHVTDMWHMHEMIPFWGDNLDLLGEENLTALNVTLDEAREYKELVKFRYDDLDTQRKKDFVDGVKQRLIDNIDKLDIHAELAVLHKDRMKAELTRRGVAGDPLSGITDIEFNAMLADIDSQKYFLDWSNSEWKGKWNFNHFEGEPLNNWNQAHVYILNTRMKIMEMLGKAKGGELLDIIKWLNTEEAYRNLSKEGWTHFRDEAQAYWNELASNFTYLNFYEKRKVVDPISFAKALNAEKAQGFEKSYDIKYLFDPCGIKKDWTSIGTTNTLTSSEKVRLALQDWGTRPELWSDGWLAEEGINFEAFVAYTGWKYVNGKYEWLEENDPYKKHLNDDQRNKIEGFLTGESSKWVSMYEWKDLKKIECYAMWKYLERNFDNQPENRHATDWGPEIDFRKREWVFWEQGFRPQKYAMGPGAEGDQFIYDQVVNEEIIENSGLDSAGRLWTGTMARYPGESRRYTPRLPFWDEDVWLDMYAGIHSSAFWGQAARTIPGMSWEGQKLYLLIFSPEFWYNPEENKGVLVRLGPMGSKTLDVDTVTAKMARYGATEQKARKYLAAKKDVLQPDFQGRVPVNANEQDLKSLVGTVTSLMPTAVKSTIPIPGLRSWGEIRAVLKGAGLGGVVTGLVVVPVFGVGWVPLSLGGVIAGVLLSADRGENSGEGFSRAFGSMVGLQGEREKRRSLEAYANTPNPIGDCAMDEEGFSKLIDTAKAELGQLVEESKSGGHG